VDEDRVEELVCEPGRALVVSGLVRAPSHEDVAQAAGDESA
jgi:hypothetical protein